MSNSSLVSYKKISPNRNSPRKHKIDTITIHCVVGQCGVESLGDVFASSSRGASSNYGIGYDGKIGMYVEEKDRSWCSSDADNDNRAITIECASDTEHPYAINDKVYNSLINLCADICKRNGIKELKWKADKSLIGQVDKQNMTVHRWFANKECPGDYIYSRLGKIAKEVNAKLKSENVVTDSDTVKKEGTKNDNAKSKYPKTPFVVDVIIDDLNYRSTPSMDGEVKGQTGKGTFTITKVTDDWGKLKSGAGWIWLGDPSYCTVKDTVKTSTKKTEADKSYKVEVSISNLNIRTGPGTNYKTIGKFTGKGVFTIVETAKGSGSKAGWGKLKSGAGWISLDYAKKV